MKDILEVAEFLIKEFSSINNVNLKELTTTTACLFERLLIQLYQIVIINESNNTSIKNNNKQEHHDVTPMEIDRHQIPVLFDKLIECLNVIHPFIHSHYLIYGGTKGIYRVIYTLLEYMESSSALSETLQSLKYKDILRIFMNNGNDIDKYLESLGFNNESQSSPEYNMMMYQYIDSINDMITNIMNNQYIILSNNILLDIMSLDPMYDDDDESSSTISTDRIPKVDVIMSNSFTNHLAKLFWTKDIDWFTSSTSSSSSTNIYSTLTFNQYENSIKTSVSTILQLYHFYSYFKYPDKLDVDLIYPNGVIQHFTTLLLDLGKCKSETTSKHIINMLQTFTDIYFTKQSRIYMIQPMLQLLQSTTTLPTSYLITLSRIIECIHHDVKEIEDARNSLNLSTIYLKSLLISREENETTGGDNSHSIHFEATQIFFKSFNIKYWSNVWGGMDLIHQTGILQTIMDYVVKYPPMDSVKSWAMDVLIKYWILSPMYCFNIQHPFNQTFNLDCLKTGHHRHNPLQHDNHYNMEFKFGLVRIFSLYMTCYNIPHLEHDGRMSNPGIVFARLIDKGIVMAFLQSFLPPYVSDEWLDQCNEVLYVIFSHFVSRLEPEHRRYIIDHGFLSVFMKILDRERSGENDSGRETRWLYLFKVMVNNIQERKQLLMHIQALDCMDILLHYKLHVLVERIETMIESNQ